MHEPLKNKTNLEQKNFNFLGADFAVPKSSHQHEKQPVLGPDCSIFYFPIALAVWLY